jgi:hypothetical protein
MGPRLDLGLGQERIEALVAISREIICPRTGRMPCPLSREGCAAIVDRLTFGGNIIETGTSSCRLARAQRQPGWAISNRAVTPRGDAGVT